LIGAADGLQLVMDVDAFVGEHHLGNLSGPSAKS
jgi:hypothetical protein